MLEAVSLIVAVVAVIASAIIGSSEVRDLRRKTGDRSLLTAVLSGEAFARRHG